MKNMTVNKAVTIVELLVVTSILLLLLAIALPAVQQVRQAAWAAQCKANLQQLGGALHQYHGDHGMVPPWTTHLRPDRFINKSLQSYLSVHGRLLPYLGYEELYHAINTDGYPVPPYGFLSAESEVFQTVVGARVAVFLCPADGGTSRWSSAVSYRANWGVGPYANRHYEFFDSGNGFFSNLSLNQVVGTRFATIRDGLSHTSMFSERTVGLGSSARHDPMRDLRLSVPIDFDTADQALRACAAMDQLQKGSFGRAGEAWLFSSLALTLYNHVLPPNSAISDCVNLGTYESGGAPTARSMHFGRVHVVFGDNSVRSINDRVSLEVWRALGSRDGGEVVLEGSY